MKLRQVWHVPALDSGSYSPKSHREVVVFEEAYLGERETHWKVKVDGFIQRPDFKAQAEAMTWAKTLVKDPNKQIIVRSRDAAYNPYYGDDNPAAIEKKLRERLNQFPTWGFKDLIEVGQRLFPNADRNLISSIVSQIFSSTQDAQGAFQARAEIHSSDFPKSGSKTFKSERDADGFALELKGAGYDYNYQVEYADKSNPRKRTGFVVSWKKS